MEWIGPDWRDAAAYAPLLGADRSLLAWEWLRRDPAYRSAARTQGGAGGPAPGSWGLHRFEHPSLGACDARPLWRSGWLGGVLVARACSPAAPGDEVDLAKLGRIAIMFEGRGGEHWLFSDGLRAIRLDLVEGTGAKGRVELHYLLHGLESLRAPLLSLRRLASLIESGQFSRSLHPPERQARRWVLALRVHDALAAGAAQREIAACLLSASAAQPRWRVDAASVRSQIQRLARSARSFASGGFRGFLR